MLSRGVLNKIGISPSVWPGSQARNVAKSVINTVSARHLNLLHYNPLPVEEKWKKKWAEQAQNKRQQQKQQDSNEQVAAENKYYSLAMFPYPSGNLHMGHVRVYTISDTLNRVYKLKGYNVLHPMGWDAFGLPAENAAIERNISSPAQWTYQNIAHMKSQLQQLAIDFDWDKEVTTCSPEYYKWTQWIFLELYRAGLAYQREALVNWDPVDQTVLANEQVDANGKSWRSGAQVEQKMLKQWFFKITEYAEDLLNDLNSGIQWPEQVKKMQERWIGRSEGSVVNFKVDVEQEPTISVFTTRIDTLYGATYLACAPENPIIETIIKNSPQRKQVEEFVHKVLSQTSTRRLEIGNQSKEGVYLGVDAINPLTGEKIPIYVADYVLMDYGQGSVMGVPAHDERDYAFAQKHGLPIKQVLQPPESNQKNDAESSACYSGEGILVNSGPFSGKSSSEARKEIASLGASQGWAKAEVEYRLRDWLVSRQRYWGAPIPIIHCPKCGPVPVPDADLPVKLPIEGVELTGKGGSPLAKLEDWVNVPCPCDQKLPSKRETDTMDTFVDSSWYFLRYIDPHNKDQIFSPEKAVKMMPVDTYVGGIEHAVLHLLYARFIHKFLWRNMMAKDKTITKDVKEPFQKLLTQGMVLGKTFVDPDTGKFVKPTEVTYDEAGKPVDAQTGKHLNIVWEKMSKSKHNGVDPTDVVNKFGADITRLYTLFKAPPEKELEWDEVQIQGQVRWLSRLHSLAEEFVGLRNQAPTAPLQLLNTREEKDLRFMVHGTIARTTQAIIEHQNFNVAVSELMKLSNALIDVPDKLKQTSKAYAEGLQMLYLMLYPMAPHVACELWERIHTVIPTEHYKDLNEQAWPEPDPSALIRDEQVVTIQINGKLQGTMMVSKTLLDEWAADKSLLEKNLVQLVLDEVRQNPQQQYGGSAEAVAAKLESMKKSKKVIVARGGKLINFVV